MRIRRVYRTASGETRVYNYHYPHRRNAFLSCRSILKAAGEMRRTERSSNWRAPNFDRQFSTSTINALVRAGHARIVGDVVVPA